MAFKLYLSPPHMGGKEMEYIKEAFDTNWIAPYGPTIGVFEKKLSEYIGMDSALALTSGTAAIHLALRWLGAQQGDYVFCSDFTFIGSCDAILYEKCIPVFIDSEDESWNMSPIALEKAFRWAQETGHLPKAVIICDLYGESADWDLLTPICKKYGVPVIEDAAEAIGSEYMGKKCGSFGDLSALSFNGNKIITTSGGGMVLANDQEAIDKMRFWSTQAREPVIWYEHKEYGYNYRMSNICACIGCGQMEFLSEKLAIRERICQTYRRELSGIPAHIKMPAEKGRSNCWLNLLCIDTDDVTPTNIVTNLANAAIETRPAWKPMHLQPVFRDAMFFSHYDSDQSSVGEEVFSRTVCLPSGDNMSLDQQLEVIDRLKKCFS